jgi:hypothetical protein
MVIWEGAKLTETNANRFCPAVALRFGAVFKHALQIHFTSFELQGTAFYLGERDLNARFRKQLLQESREDAELLAASHR